MEERRRFLKLLTSGGASALLSGCLADSAEDPDQDAVFKDVSPFIRHGSSNLETKMEDMRGFITPVEQFFVRNNDVSQDIETETYRLEVTGDAVEMALSLTYADLLSMPSRTVFSTVECGGNQRAFFGSVLGKVARGTPWGRGAVGMAVWTGVSLCEVLSRAGIRDTARDLQLIGLDSGAPEGGFRRPLPIEKAMDPDTLLAYQMNGSILPRDHGYPLRAIVPGWVGSSSIKWLGRIEVSSQKIWSRNNTTSYVLIGEDYPEQGEAQGQVVTTQSIKSTLALPWPAQLVAGHQNIRGYAQSPHAPIQRVEWSDDEGQTWQQARVLDPIMHYAWARFEIEWEATRGEHIFMTRAIDEKGNMQPETIPYNQKGYLFNMPLPHPIRIV